MIFDEALRQLALSYSKEPMAHCGDIVATRWGIWKHEHSVMIYRVGVEIVSLRGQVPSDLIMGVEHRYCALRLNKDGKPKEKYGIALTHFTTKEGLYWEKKHQDFNHIGLSFDIEEIPEEERP